MTDHLARARDRLAEAYAALDEAAGSRPPLEAGAVRELRADVAEVQRRLRNILLFTSGAAR